MLFWGVLGRSNPMSDTLFTSILRSGDDPLLPRRDAIDVGTNTFVDASDALFVLVVLILSSSFNCFLLLMLFKAFGILSNLICNGLRRIYHFITIRPKAISIRMRSCEA